MISFRKKNIVQDLVPEALEYLKQQGITPNIIAPEDADAASRVNSKAMVLVGFTRNSGGYYELKLKDKELYNYTQKLVRDYFKMRVTNIDKATRTITAEVDHKGVALDIIEILGEKYNLSVVVNN